MSGSEEGYFGGPKWFNTVLWLFAILAVVITLLEEPLTIISIAAGALVLIIVLWEVSFSFARTERTKNIIGTVAVCSIGVVLSVGLGMLNAYAIFSKMVC